MSLTFECPYCASCDNKLISSFYSGVLEAKTAVYQCEQCLNLFDLPRNVDKQELQQRLRELREDAEERIAVATASNVMGMISNPELSDIIAQIQQNSLTAQLSLIFQGIATVNPTNQELLDKLNKQKTDIQLKIIEIQKQQLQNRLNDLREDAEERISVTSGSELSLDPGDESLMRVVIYGYDDLNNRVPLDSYWANSSDFSLSSLELEILTSFDTFITIFADSSISYLLRLLCGVFQVVFGFWLLCLAFGF
jgi:hypothetical protein